MSNARVILVILLLTGAALTQDYPTAYIIRPNQQILVPVTPHPVQSKEASAPLQAALATIFQNPELCCGPNSSLENVPATSASLSTRELAAKLAGRHTLSDGRPFTVTTELIDPATMNATQLLTPLKQNRVLLMQWNSRWYLLVGADYDEWIYDGGLREYSIHKLRLLDFSNPAAPKEAIFDRQKDDWTKVQGLLLLNATVH